ncbi:MAG: hypothetical protein WC879_05760 [Melioribacteraceae bacterium]
MKNDLFIQVPECKLPPKNIKILIENFRNDVESFESKNNYPFYLLQDGKSEAFYIDCHLSANNIIDKLDYEASLDPEEQDDIKANRSLLPLHKLFLKMQEDARKGRQFNDIIVEFMPYGNRADKPLKIYGGQHRAKSIEESYKAGLNRYHGFRVFFGLTIAQRNDIAQVSNANINVPMDLLDRMQETVLGPQLRNWCKAVGLITKEFAEKKNNEGIISARMARTFVINFHLGKENKDALGNRAYYNLAGNEANEKYLRLTHTERIKLLDDSSLTEAGKYFAKLHKKQMESIRKDSELSKLSEFKTKALTPSILSAWAFSSGLLQRDKKRLEKFYKLQDKTKSKNPLSAKEMSEYKHLSDLKTYRGLGTRSDRKERGKLIELFLLYSEKQEPTITHNLIDAAVTNFLTFSLEEERKKKLSRVK